jgi:hypothetical protein
MTYPSSLIFISCNIQTCWELWWNGNPAERCAPYRLVRGIDLIADDKKNKTELAKARKVMEKLVSLLEDPSIAAIATASLREKRLNFQAAIMALYGELFPNRSSEEFDRFRFGDLSYLRVYDLIIKNASSVLFDNK